MTRWSFAIAALSLTVSAECALAQQSYIRQTDFVVTDVGGTPIVNTLDNVAASEPEVSDTAYSLSGEIGTLWSAAGKLAYVRERGAAYELIYDDALVAESEYPIVQLGDISTTLAYCERIEDGNTVRSVAHIGSTRSYTFPEDVCNASTMSGNELISYGSAVYVNGARTIFSVPNGNILSAFRYKNSLVYIAAHNTPFETRLMVGPTKLASAPGLEGSIIEAAVQGGKLAYSIYRPDAGWSVIWGGEVVSRYHAYITGFLQNAKKLTYVAMTPKGAMLFRDTKVYGVGYDLISFVHETPRGNVIYVTTKTTQEHNRTARTKMQDVLWFNGTKLLQSLYAQNVFSKVVVIQDAYPLVIVEDMSGKPQYIWYQGMIGLRGQKVLAAAQAGDRVALLIEHKNLTREIVYIALEQGQ